jgi:hypothetical protein
MQIEGERALSRFSSCTIRSGKVPEKRKARRPFSDRIEHRLIFFFGQQSFGVLSTTSTRIITRWITEQSMRNMKRVSMSTCTPDFVDTGFCTRKKKKK